MNCPYCDSTANRHLSARTSLGYLAFRCSTCFRRFDERTGTRYNHLQFPTDIVLLVVLWRLRYKGYTACETWPRCSWLVVLSSSRKLYEVYAVRDWEARFAPLITQQLRARRRSKAGYSWHVDETYVKVNGKWCYLYRAIDRDGNLVDSMLSEHRDMEAAKKFLTQTKAVVDHRPTRVTTDGHDAYPRAIRRILGRKVEHRTNKYLNNRIEQDHRGIKQRYYPMRGFGSFESAARFCSAYDEQKDYFLYRTRPKEKVSLSEQRRMFGQRFGGLQYLLIAG